jgi:type 1 fimbriae regulatory protein FimB/type 1 fimbriae regulatory protein FimE
MGAVVPLLREEPVTPKRRTPKRLPNAELRTREHLTEHEVERLIETAKGNRHGHRDSTMILVAFTHGLRASELVNLKWDAVDFAGGRLHVNRAKRGTPATHPLRGVELRALRRLKRESTTSPYVFVSERGAPFSGEGFSRMLQRTAKVAGLASLRIHPHMLRHATGYKLANDGQDTRALQHYLGHKNIQHTVRYTELAPSRFKNFWRD